MEDREISLSYLYTVCESKCRVKAPTCAVVDRGAPEDAAGLYCCVRLTMARILETSTALLKGLVI